MSPLPNTAPGTGRSRRRTAPPRSLRLVLVIVLLVTAITPGALAAPAAGNDGLLWSAGLETGDLSEWYRGQEGAVVNEGTGEVGTTDQVAHTGRYAMVLTIKDASGVEQAARIFRWAENAPEAYYSVWMYFPERCEPAAWWNVFQFKGRDENEVTQASLTLNVGNRADGSMFLYLYSMASGQSWDPSATVNIPVGAWTHVEVYVRRSSGTDGKITVWEDGVVLFDIDGIQTAFRNSRGQDNIQWSLNNYTDNIIPSSPAIFMDDAAISTDRIGEG